MLAMALLLHGGLLGGMGGEAAVGTREAVSERDTAAA